MVPFPAVLRRRARQVLAAGAVSGALLLLAPMPAFAAEVPPSAAGKACKHPGGIGVVLRPLSMLRCALFGGTEPESGVAGGGSATVTVLPAGTGHPAVEWPVVPSGPITSCDPPADLAVPWMVGAIFRCRLTEAGLAPDEVRYSTAEALAVAECESRFDADIVVFDGRYLDSPHPATGLRYSAAGVFQFIRPTAERWIEGGYANVTDPRKNIDAAARLYVANLRGGYPPWGDWACAAVNDGFAKRSVLPGWPGGPAELPAWAFDF